MRDKHSRNASFSFMQFERHCASPSLFSLPSFEGRRVKFDVVLPLIDLLVKEAAAIYKLLDSNVNGIPEDVRSFPRDMCYVTQQLSFMFMAMAVIQLRSAMKLHLTGEYMRWEL